MLQIPSGAPTEFRDHDVAVAEEVDVEVGVGTGLGVRLVEWLRGGKDGYLLRGIYTAGEHGEATLLLPQIQGLLSTRSL